MRFGARLEDQPKNPRPLNPHRFALMRLPCLHPPLFQGHRPLLWAMTMGVDGVLSPQIPISVLPHFGKARR